MCLLLIVRADSRSVDFSHHLDEMNVLAGSGPAEATGWRLKLAQKIQWMLFFRLKQQSLGSGINGIFLKIRSFDVLHVVALIH